MLRKLIVFCLLLCFNRSLFAQLKQIHLESTENHMYNGSFYNVAEGYISSLKYVGYTSDTGHTITQKAITPSNVNFNNYPVNLTFGFEISGVKAFNKNNIIVYGDYGLVPAILYSNDGGSTFKLVFHSQLNTIPNSYISDMIFPTNGSTGYSIDVDRILKTTDGGLTWVVSNTLVNAHYNRLQALTDNIVYAFSSYGTAALYGTTNGGSSWQKLTLPAANVTSVYFLNATKAWATDNNGNVWLTTNGATSWTKQNDATLAPLAASKMQFTNDSTGYAIVNGSYQVFKTTNSGKIWERLQRDNNYSYLGYGLNDVQIAGFYLWTCGGHGFIQNSSNGGGTVIPKAIFKYDTTGLSATSKIKLQNYSRPGYTYSWLVNGKQVANTYNASYTADIYAPNDTIKLICSNGSYADTATVVTGISKGIVIYSFTPTSALTGATVTISGANFNNITGVSFSGVPAKSFTVIGNYSILAVVAAGASGNITVTSAKSQASKAGFTYIPPPTITSFSPTSAITGSTIVINGTGFTDVLSVTINGYSMQSYTVVSSTQINAVVPDISGPIIVNTQNGPATLAGFKILPNITGLDKTSGTFGTGVTILGTGLTGVTAVDVDGFPVRSSTLSGNGVYVVLGEGGTAGKFTLTTPNGSATYSAFTYYQTVKIKSFLPVSGAIGTTITIKGSNFDKVTTGNIVYFGIERALVMAATDTTLTVGVPLGANYQPINVTAHGTTCYSATPFLVTFTNSSGGFDNGSFSKTNQTFNNNNTKGVILADMNNDNHPEVIAPALYSDGNIGYIYPNHSTPGKLSLGVSFMRYRNGNAGIQESGSLDVVATDENMDGIPDLVFIGIDRENLKIDNTIVTAIEGNSNYASFTDVYLQNFGSTNWDPAIYSYNLDVADMDGDGKRDYVIGYPWGLFPNVFIADVDGDGKPDVLVKSSNNVLIYRNTSTKGTITYAAPVTFNTGRKVNAIFSGDFDNDGELEIAITTGASGSGSVIILKNTGAAGTINLTTLQNVTTGGEATGGCVADIDGDGKIDLIVANNGNVSIYKNTASGLFVSFGSPVNIAHQYVSAVVAGDMDGDGRPDIICTTSNGFDGAVILNKLSNTNGITSFTPGEGLKGATIAVTGSGFTGATAVTIGGSAVQSFTVNSDKSISIIAGTGVSGYINVATSAGTLVSLTPFIFTPAPVITSFTNFYNNKAGITGGAIAITGTNFTGATKVSFGGVDAAAFTVYSSTSISAQVGAGASGDVLVTTPAGTGTQVGFIYIPVPVISAVGNNILLPGGFVTISTPAVSGCTYQWYANGNYLTGATSATYNATFAAAYTVQVVYNGGLTQTSAGFTVATLFTLPASNFNISSTSVTCKGLNNGAINIRAAQNLAYTATITGKANSTVSFTNTAAVNNLAAGTYNVCITVANQPTYQQCFTLVINEPKDLTAYSLVNPNNKTITLALSGGSVYNIQLNGVLHTTTDSSIILPLAAGRNDLIVTTDKPCQGIIDKTITASDNMVPYPNPVNKILYINLSGRQVTNARVEIYSTMGALVYRAQFNNPGNTLQLDVSALPAIGQYSLKLTTDGSQKVFNIIKQ